MKKLLFTCSLAFVFSLGYSQIWKEDIPKGKEFTFDNYSTTFLGDIDSKTPILVAAIPYNGAYNNFEQSNAPLDLSFTGSLYSFKSTLSNKGQHLFTYDSGKVYFLVFNLSKKSITDYEYRILLDGKSIIKPWTTITDITKIDINNFEEAAQLGGYQTEWGHFISAEIKRKNSDSVIAITQISWKETKPVVTGVFHSKNLHQFFTSLKRPWEEIKGISPNSLVFEYPEHSIIFNLRDEIFKKHALEYQLRKEETVIRPWGQNDYDDSFIWLKDLPPGKYFLDIRYSKQRHNPNTYRFEIKPQFHQTSLFKIIAGSLIAAFFGFILFFFRARKQTQKLNASLQEKEKLALSVRSVRSQLNPHFVFNALGSIQSLVNSNNNEKANEYLVSFSSLLRQTLQVNDKEFIPASEEAKMLERYLYLEQLRFSFIYSITIEKGLENFEVPVFLLQPLVENAVKHGVSSKQADAIITLSFTGTSQTLMISIEDNGTGFVVENLIEGHGLRLVNQRIQLMNESDSGKYITMKIESEASLGTKISLTISNTD